MIKILFVCLGNICRSPMAEFIFKNLVNKENLEDKIYVESAGTSDEEYGMDMYYLAKEKLLEEGVPFSKRASRQINKDDYNNFDIIVGMEDRNVKNMIKVFGEDKEGKVFKLLDFSNNPKDIADPWYSGNFDITYREIVLGSKGLLEYVKREMINKS